MNDREQTAASAADATQTANTAAVADQTDRRGADGEPSGSRAEPPAAEKVEGFWALDFGVHKSLRYHAKRRRFFDWMHRTAQAVSAIGASAAFVAIMGDTPTVYASSAALALAVAAGLDLVVGFAERARIHDGLYHRFSDLAAEIANTETATPADIRKWTSMRLQIEKDEPTALSDLNVICHNEEAEARGYGDDMFWPVGWFRALICQVNPCPPGSYTNRAQPAP